MSPVASFGLIFAVAASGLAQRGSAAGHGGGGMAARSAGSFSQPHFAPPSSGGLRSFGNAPRLASQPSRPQYNSPTGGAPFGGSYPYGERSRHTGYYGQRPYYYSRSVYAVPGWLTYGIGGFGYSDDPSYAPDQQQANADPGPQGMPSDSDPSQQTEGPRFNPARPEYQSSVATPADPQDQPAVTLLFKDGRPPQQVQNYAVTRDTFYVLDGARRREIPIHDLDVPETERANRDAGVDLEIPSGAL